MGSQGRLLLMKLKFLIIMTRPQNVLFLSECFAALWSLSKILISSTAGGLSCPVWFHIFFTLAFFNFGHYFFYTRGVLVEMYYITWSFESPFVTEALKVNFQCSSQQNTLVVNNRWCHIPLCGLVVSFINLSCYFWASQCNYQKTSCGNEYNHIRTIGLCLDSVSLYCGKQVDILISKNQALQVLYLKHHARQ